MTQQAQQPESAPKRPRAGARRPNPRIARFFERIGLAVVGFFFLFGVAECGTRCVDAAINDVPFFGSDKTAELYDEHPFLYRVPRPNASFQNQTVNSHGFRGADFEMPKPDGVYRILTLGGSAAWDPNVTDDDATWAAQLELRLDARAEEAGSKTRFEVVNGGVPGYNSAESFMNFVWRGVHVDPDAVLVYQGYNDFKPNRYPDFRPDYSHFRSRDHSVLTALSKGVRVLYHLTRLVSKLRSRPEGFDTVAEEGVAAFQDNLRNIAVLAESKGIRPILATYGMSVTEENFEEHPEKLGSLDKYLPWLTKAGVLDAHRRYNEAVVELARERGLVVIDVDAHVPRDYDHYWDHCHFVDAGSAAAADIMAEVIWRDVVLAESLQ